MKILLFGEFSGLFTCLREGLVALGHEVVTASDGNGYKNYPRDLDWYVNPKLGRLRHFIELKKVYDFREKLKGYDIVYIIHPQLFSRYVWAIRPVYDYLINNNGKVFICGAGSTAVMANYWLKSGQKYQKYIEGNLIDLPNLKAAYSKQSLIDWEYELLEKVNGFIPIWYEYAQPFRNHPKLLPTVRIPIIIEKFEYIPNKVNGKIVFFHGIPTRQNAKGTAYIKKAFEIMEKKYGDVAEFFCAGGLPFNDYIQLVSRTNVILDDANSYSIAMNGLFSLAKGKLVMGGAEPIANKELGFEKGDNPVFNLCPDVDQICSQIEYVITHKNEIEDLGYKGRQFVEKYHDHKDIAKKYIDIFEKY